MLKCLTFFYVYVFPRNHLLEKTYDKHLFFSQGVWFYIINFINNSVKLYLYFFKNFYMIMEDFFP